MPDLHRRDLLVQGSAALAAMAVLYPARYANAFPSRPGEVAVPWLDQPPPGTDPCCDTQLVWENLELWVTPNEKFFAVSHFDRPSIDASSWKLEIDGLVNKPDEPVARRSQGAAPPGDLFTLECSGNDGFPDFVGAIGNASWAGTPLAALLEEAGVKDSGIEVVFWGNDVGDIELHDDIRDVKMHQNFARSMSLEDAMSPDNILCYEMNGVDLPGPHGAPLRLIAPGWYGIANVKWLKRIEIRDRRFQEPADGAGLCHHPRGGA